MGRVCGAFGDMVRRRWRIGNFQRHLDDGEHAETLIRTEPIACAWGTLPETPVFAFVNLSERHQKHRHGRGPWIRRTIAHRLRK
jgi:hypothetical protein